jgi:hypothetical protein
MKNFVLTLTLFALLGIGKAAPGDTTIVQTCTYTDPSGFVGRYLFPDNSKQYEKILMLYSVKCGCDGLSNCGEWDYDRYTEISKDASMVVSNTIYNPIDTTYIFIGTTEQGEMLYDTIIHYDTVYQYSYVLQNPWKIGTFISPYGNGLVLNNGWTWVYDVTDFGPMLQDSVFLKNENWGGSVDIKFLFIEGVPARDIINIRKIWQTYVSLAQFDEVVTATTIELDPAEKMAKLRTTVTGHGFGGTGNSLNCAEFCSNYHSIKSNGELLDSWDILQPCGDNPLYPQGGTWPFDRAGWCPGMPATVHELELTDYITNNSINFDYDITYYNHGSYHMDGYLVTYGDINQSVDVAISDIIAPNTNFLYKRYNPTCGNPIIKIKNVGANNLTSVDIHYGFGTHEYVYHWTGDLSFMSEITLDLPRPNWNEAGAGEATNTFFVELKQPNGLTDPTPYNNRMTATFKLPPIYDNSEYRMSLKTDMRPRETTWRIKDMNGNTIAQSPATNVGNTIYNTDFTLQSGSYVVELIDSGGDGMTGWWYGESSNGSVVLRRKSVDGSWQTCNSFNYDFGNSLRFYFAVNQFTKINEISSNLQNVSLYPNPAQSELNLDITNFSSTQTTVTIYDLMGRAVMEQNVTPKQIHKLNISHLSSGIHFIVVSDNGHLFWRGKFIKL